MNPALQQTRKIKRTISQGKIKGFTGIDAPYEEPKNPELVIETDKYNIDESAQLVVDYLTEKGVIKKSKI